MSEDGRAGGRPRLESGALSTLLGFQLSLAQVTVQRDFAIAVDALNVTRKQYAIMELVDANAGVSQVDLAATLLMDRATMMALVDRLEARDLIVRQASLHDRRRQTLHLTEPGSTLLHKARAAILAHEARLFAGWSLAERKALHAALTRLANAGRPEPGG